MRKATVSKDKTVHGERKKTTGRLPLVPNTRRNRKLASYTVFDPKVNLPVGIFFCSYLLIRYTVLVPGLGLVPGYLVPGYLVLGTWYLGTRYRSGTVKSLRELLNCEKITADVDLSVSCHIDRSVSWLVLF